MLNQAQSEIAGSQTNVILASMVK